MTYRSIISSTFNALLLSSVFYCLSSLFDVFAHTLHGIAAGKNY
jgi:hypothetical protein